METEFERTSDEGLVRESRSGSLTAFEQLVYRYEGRVFAFVFNFCRHTIDAREVTQETFVKAFQSLVAFDPQRSFASWLFTIARHKCIDRQRAARRVSDEPVPELVDEEDPARLLVREEERQTIWSRARSLLPEAQYQALWLRYVEDLEVVEIARVLGKTRTHVKVMLFRARQALGKELRKDLERERMPVSVERPATSTRGLREQAWPRGVAAAIAPGTARPCLNPGTPKGPV